MQNDHSTGYKPYAVITGASSGIGYELAKQFAQNNYDLLIVAEDEKIFSVQDELESFGVSVESLQTDLSNFAGVQKLAHFIKLDERPIDAVAINAGVGVGGPFTETNLKEEISMINLNVVSVVHQSKFFLKQMERQKYGKILFTSSIASVMPAPFEAVYGASKAFITSFTEALRNEFKDKGITITTLMPGATNTNFFHRAHLDDTKVGAEGKYENEAKDVAKQGFDALMAGQESVYAASLKTKFQGWASKIIPENMKAQMHRKLSEPGSAHQ